MIWNLGLVDPYNGQIQTDALELIGWLDTRVLSRMKLKRGLSYSYLCNVHNFVWLWLKNNQTRKD
jgi:hypothetical protein